MRYLFVVLRLSRVEIVTCVVQMVSNQTDVRLGPLLCQTLYLWIGYSLLSVWIFYIYRGVGTGGGGHRGQGPHPSFHKKCPFSGGKVPFAFVQIAFLTHGCCKATSVSLCGYLNVGQLNNEK